MKCFDCDQPATLVNHTQFAGTHYWCEAHVPPEDRSDCEQLKPCKSPYCECEPNQCTHPGFYDARTQQSEPMNKLNPLYITSDFKEHYKGGFATKPHEVTCTLTYNDPKLPQIVSEATEHTHHKAKAIAYKQLEEQFEVTKFIQEQESLKDRFETRAATVLHDYFSKPEPVPTEHIQRLLDKLQEEAAEIIQAVSKIRRFGPHNHHPDRNTTNLQELIGELEDFQAIVWALEEIDYLDPKPSTTSTIKKYQTLIST